MAGAVSGLVQSLPECGVQVDPLRQAVECRSGGYVGGVSLCQLLLGVGAYAPFLVFGFDGFHTLKLLIIRDFCPVWRIVFRKKFMLFHRSS